MDSYVIIIEIVCNINILYNNFLLQMILFRIDDGRYIQLDWNLRFDHSYLGKFGEFLVIEAHGFYFCVIILRDRYTFTLGQTFDVYLADAVYLKQVFTGSFRNENYVPC